MTELWINFAIVIGVQFLLFLIHAWYEHKLKDVPRILSQSIVIGILFGSLFDLVVGKYVGVYMYTLGFGPGFLIINGALSYGLMQANTLLMQRAQALHFYAWTLVVGFVYEVTNYFFLLWSWEFGSPLVELLVVHLVGYPALALLMAFVWNVLFKKSFVVLDAVIRR